MAVPQGILGALQNSPFANSIRKADPYEGTRFEGFTGLGNDGYGSLSQGPMDRVLSDGFFVNDPRRTTPLPNELEGVAGGNLKQLPERGMMDILTSYMNDYSTPEERLQMARGRMMSRDIKPKAENDALMYITQNQGDINQDRLDFLKYRQSIRPTFGTNSATTADVKPGEISFDEFINQGKPSSYTGGNRPTDVYARPQPGMFPQPVETNPNFRPNLPYRPNPNLPFNGNPNMYQRPMRRPFGFGGRRPMNPFMGMGLGMMNPMGMGMFGGFPMRPPMFGGFGGGYGGGFGGRPMMGYGIGGANPYGMSPYSNFGRPTPYSQPSYNRPNPYQQPSYTPSQNPNQVYDGNMRPISGAYSNPNTMPNIMQQQPQYNNMYQQPQQGGYGGYQQPSGYGNYGGMQNPYQPQQMGNANNFAGYGQQQPAGMF
jgi:hypothetical protein